MVFFGGTLIISVIKIGMLDVLPLLVDPQTSWFKVHIVWAIFLSTNVIYNYALGVLSDPGSHKGSAYKKICKMASDKFGKDFLKDLTARTSAGPYEWTRCRKSGMPKPPRAHFDSVTKRLVIQMDHYCPWLFNTVGWGNFRYYLMFQYHLVFSTVYITIMTYRPFCTVMNQKAYTGPHQNHEANAGGLQALFTECCWQLENGTVINRSQKTMIVYLFMISLAVVMFLGAFVLWNTHLLVTAQTSIEVQINQKNESKAKAQGLVYRNPYDQGWWANWKQLMGPYPILSHLVPYWPGPLWPPYPTMKMHSTYPNSKSNGEVSLQVQTAKHGVSDDQKIKRIPCRRGSVSSSSPTPYAGWVVEMVQRQKQAIE